MIAQLDKEYIKTRPTKTISRLMSYAIFEGRPATTNGRWINKFVFLQLWILKQLPQLKKVRQPIFIIGTGRSGTTILGLFLSMHPKLGYLNEPKAMWNSIYDLEDIIGSYSKKHGNYRLAENNATDSTVKKAHKIFGGYLTSIFTARVVDKYPELIFRIPFVKRIFPDAKFVFLQRNPWDTCNSIASWSKRKGIQENIVEDWWGVNDQKWKIMVDELISKDEVLKNHTSEIANLTDHKLRALVEWYLVMKEGINMQKKYSTDIISVKYEDLASKPRNELLKILNFCNLAKDNKTFEYAEKVISPAPPTKKFSMPSVLVDPLKDIMDQLNYL
jgi:hypothetical protein